MAGLETLRALQLDHLHYILNGESAAEERVLLLVTVLEIHYTTFLFCRQGAWGMEWLNNLSRGQQDWDHRARTSARSPLYHAAWGVLRTVAPLSPRLQYHHHLQSSQCTIISSAASYVTNCTIAWKFIMCYIFNHAYIGYLNYYYLNDMIFYQNIYLPKQLKLRE